MSGEGELTISGAAIGLIGIIILALGLLLVYFSLIAEAGVVNLQILTPIGVVVALVGGFMIITKKA